MPASWRASLKGLAGGLQGVLPVADDGKRTLVHQFEARARQQPARTFLLYRDLRFSYGEANALVNRHAAAYREAGLRKGDVVALVLENRPELYWHLLALMKLGVVPSLVNSHAVGKPLAHAIRICAPRRVVVGSEVLGPFAEVRGEIGDAAVDVDLDAGAAAPAGYPLWSDRLPVGPCRDPVETAAQTMGDLAAYLYTSGTTGMPKAALLKHNRLFRAGSVFGGFGMQLGADDVVYLPLPLYHGTALIVGSASAISFGSTIALARRFSVGAFWEDCRKFGATRFLYIGELCRYLHGAPRKRADRDHSHQVDLRQRPASRHLGKLSGALRHRAGRRVLRLHRGQRGHDEPRRSRRLRRQDAPPAGHRALGRHTRRFRSRARRASAALPARRRGRHAGQDCRRERVRRLPGSRGDGGQDRPRGVRPGGRLVQHRGPDAGRSTAKPVLRRSTRETRSDGRARTSPPSRSRSSSPRGPASRRSTSMECRSPAWRAGPAWRRSSSVRGSSSTPPRSRPMSTGCSPSTRDRCSSASKTPWRPRRRSSSKRATCRGRASSPSRTALPLFVRHPGTGDYLPLSDVLRRDIAAGRLAL